MQNYVYIQYIVGQLLILFLGYNFLRNAIIGYIVALLSLAALVPVLIRFVPGYIYYIIFFIIISNSIYFFYKKYHLELYSKIKHSFKELLIFIFINLFFLIILNQFHFKNFIYEAHDIVYWSPSIELYYSDYIGNIKNFTYYPATLTAHPLFPTSVFSVASILVTDLTLISLLEIRYLLICNFLTLACYLFYEVNNNYKKIDYIYYFLLFIILFYSFENYIAYSLMFSGIFSVLIFILLLANFENTDETSIKFNSYLSLFLLVTKPGIMFIFAIFPVYYFFKFKIVRKDILFYILSLFIFLNMLTWVIIEKPISNSDLAIFNPFKLSEYYQTLLLNGWTSLGSIFQNFETFYHAEPYIMNFQKDETNLKNIFEAYKLNMIKVNFDLFKFFVIFLFLFLIPFILVLKNYKKNHVFSYFIILSFIILVFLRNENMFGNKTTSQVAHILYIMPIFLTYVILKSFLNKNNLKLNSIIIVCVILLFSNFKINYGSKTFSNRANSPESVTYSKFLKDKDKYSVTNNFLTNLNFGSSSDVHKLEIYALMMSKRIRKEEYDKYDLEFTPSILPWSMPRYHDYIWNYAVIKKNSM